MVMALVAMPEFASAQNDIEETTLIKVGDKAPNFTVEMVDGSSMTLADMKGKVVVVNFWATWCPPCRQELKVVQKQLIDHFKDEPFVFLPISRGEKREIVESYIEKMGYTFPIGLDFDQSAYSKYATNYIPRSVVVGRDGVVAYVAVGYDEQIAGEIEEAISEALKK
jgi:peroxiredoxin